MSTEEKAGRLLPAVFSYGENQMLRAMMIEDQPWMVAKDVCDSLGITHSKDIVRNCLDEDEKLKRIVFAPGFKNQRRLVWLVNESGFYNLVFRSRKPEAKAFRK